MTTTPTFKVNDAVVYAHPDGGSVSARITHINSFGTVFLRFAVPYNGQHVAKVQRHCLHRLTPFGNAMFLAMPS